MSRPPTLGNGSGGWRRDGAPTRISTHVPRCREAARRRGPRPRAAARRDRLGGAGHRRRPCRVAAARARPRMDSTAWATSCVRCSPARPARLPRSARKSGRPASPGRKGVRGHLQRAGYRADQRPPPRLVQPAAQRGEGGLGARSGLLLGVGGRSRRTRSTNSWCCAAPPVSCAACRLGVPGGQAIMPGQLGQSAA